MNRCQNNIFLHNFNIPGALYTVHYNFMGNKPMEVDTNDLKSFILIYI